MATKTPLQEYYDSINTLPIPQEDTSVISDYLNPTEDQLTDVPDIQTGNPLQEYLDSGIEAKDSPGFEVFQGTETLDDLEKDPEFQMRAQRFMKSIQDDEEIFEYLRDSDFSLSSAMVRSGQVKGWSDQAKEDYNYLRQRFDNADIGSAGQYMQLAKNLSVDLLADPLNWLAAIFFVPSGGWSGGAAAGTLLAGKEAAKMSLKQIAKASLKDATKPAIYGAAEGATWAGPHDFFLQKADIELGLRDEVNWGQTALTTGIGAGIGAILGGSIGTVTSGTPLLYHKYTSKYADDVTISQKGEVSKDEVIDQYVDEKAVEIADDDFQVKRKDDTDTGETKQEKKKRKKETVKKITKTKEAISNTVGKSVTQFVDIAQNAPRLQQLLGQYRSDWAKTLLRGNDKAMLATYGESVSKRMWGYMAELRASVGELSRNQFYLFQPSTWKNTIDKTQNDNLIWLLRLNNASFKEIVELKKVDKIDPQTPLPTDRIRTASTLDKDIDIEINIFEKDLKNDAGQIVDDEIIRAAAKIRDVLDRIYYEASGGTEVFNGVDFVNLNLMTDPIGDVVGFFPRHFSYSKISEDPEGLIELIKNSKHSDPSIDPKETAKLKVRDPVTGEILLDEAGKDRLVFAATELSIDQNTFGLREAAKIADLAETDMNAAKQYKAELIVKDMLDKRYSPFEFGTESSGGGGASFLQHRVFRELDDNALAPYLENNVEDVLETYIQNASRAITRTAYFGRNEEDFIKKYISGPGNIAEQLLEAGVSRAEIDRVNTKLKKMYNRVTGLDASSLQWEGTPRAVADTIKLTQQMAHLPFATISSVTEPMILLSRIDDTKGKLTAGGEVGKAIVKGMKKDIDKLRYFARRASGKEVKGFADMQDDYWTEAYKVGLALEQGVMAHIEGLYGEAPKNKFLQGMQNAFFKANFLTTWTGAVQLASFTTGKRLIRENTEKLYNHREGIQKLSNAKKDYLSEQLSDLGIDEKDALRWYKNSLDNNGVFDEGRARGANKFSELKVGRNDMRKRQLAFYENRLTNGANRFTKEIILNPSTSEANRPMWFSHPAGQLLAQFAGYPTVFNNTILKRWSYESAEDIRKVGRGELPQATPKILGTSLAMTSVAVFMNAVRSGGASLEQDDETIIIEAIQRWGGLGPADVLYRTQQNSMYGSGPAGTILKAAPGPIVSDVVDAIAYRKGIPEIFLTNTPFFSALPPEVRKDLRADARALQKSLSKGMFPDEEEYEYIAPYAKGGVVNVPNASTEPDEKKVRGMPFTYAELGGVLAQDVEDRRGFVFGGLVSRISRTLNPSTRKSLMTLTEETGEDEVINHLTKEIRKAEPLFESNATTSLYKKAEADDFAKNVDEEAVRYVNSDKLNELEEELRYATELGVKATTKPKASGGKKIKYKGRLRLVRPLELEDVSPETLTGSRFVEAIQTNSALKNKIINNSPLPKEDARKLVKLLVDNYNDTQKLVRGYSKQPIETIQPLLDIKQSIKARETLTDLGYDSIRYNDSEYILFDNNQFRVSKKLQLKERMEEALESTLSLAGNTRGLRSRKRFLESKSLDKLDQAVLTRTKPLPRTTSYQSQVEYSQYGRIAFLKDMKDLLDKGELSPNEARRLLKTSRFKRNTIAKFLRPYYELGIKGTQTAKDIDLGKLGFSGGGEVQKLTDEEYDQLFNIIKTDKAPQEERQSAWKAIIAGMRASGGAISEGLSKVFSDEDGLTDEQVEFLRTPNYQGGRVGYANGEEVDEEDLLKLIQEKLAASKVTYGAEEKEDDSWYLGKNIKEGAKELQNYLQQDKPITRQPQIKEDEIISQEMLDKYKENVMDKFNITDSQRLPYSRVIEETVHYLESRQGRNKNTELNGPYQISAGTQKDAVKNLRDWHSNGKGMNFSEETLEYLETTPRNEMQDNASRLLLNATLFSRPVKDVGWTLDNEVYIKDEGTKLVKQLYESKSWEDMQEVYLKLWVYHNPQEYEKITGTNIGSNLQKGKKFYIKELKNTMFSD